MICSAIARTSASVLAIGGLALLFLGDTILPLLIAGFPPTGAWLGQMLAGAWLGVSALTWNARSALLGGIYGRPVVLTNATLFLVSALSLVRSLLRENAAAPASPLLVVMTIVCAILAALYFWLMLRGPLARDAGMMRGAHAP